MTTIEERREIAAKLRALPNMATMGDLAECVFGRKCSWSAGALADEIADLIDPCDRDALIALAEGMRWSADHPDEVRGVMREFKRGGLSEDEIVGMITLGWEEDASMIMKAVGA